MKRTDEQKLQFVKECLKIEKAGGNVLGYIEVNWPSYTPRGTWFNLQKQFTGRRGPMLTDGKPKEKPRKEKRELGKSKQKLSELIEALLDGVRAGNDPWKVLTAMGYKNPPSAMKSLKNWCLANDPDLLPELQKIVLHDPSKAFRKQVKEMNTGDHVSAEEYRKSVEFNGKKFEQMRREHIGNLATMIGLQCEEERQRTSPTCCQPARQCGPIKWNDNEAMTDGQEEISMRKLSIKEVPIKELKLRTLQGEMGTYEKLADDRMLFTGSPRPFTDCGYTVAEWFVLIEELQIAIKQLGLD